MFGKNVLVTGGSGFLGIHLIQALLEKQASVTVVDMEKPQTGPKAEFFALDVGSKGFHSLLKEKEFDVIFHLAGVSYVPVSVKNPLLDFESNASNTLKILECLRKHDSESLLVFASSAAVYGNPTMDKIPETAPILPVSPYGVSKAAADCYVREFARCYGLRTVAARIFSMYGPGQKKQVVFDFLSKLKKCQTRIEVYGDGTQERDFIFVKDAVNALVVLAEKGSGGQAYNVGSGKSITIKQLLLKITEKLGIEPEIAYAGNRPGDQQRFCADISKISALGFEPKYSIGEGLNETIGWFNALK